MKAQNTKPCNVRFQLDLWERLHKRYPELGYRNVSHLLRVAAENALNELDTPRDTQLNEFLQVRLKVLEKKAQDFERQLTRHVLQAGYSEGGGPSALGIELKELIQELIQEIKSIKP